MTFSEKVGKGIQVVYMSKFPNFQLFQESQATKWRTCWSANGAKSGKDSDKVED